MKHLWVRQLAVRLGSLAVGALLLATTAEKTSVAVAGQAPQRPERPPAARVFDIGLAGRPGPTEATPGEVIIRLKPSRSLQPGKVTAEALAEVRRSAMAEAQQVVAAVGAQVVADAVFGASARQPEGLFLYKVRIPAGMSVDEGVRRLSALRGVVYASPNYKRYPDVTYVEKVKAVPKDAAPPGSVPPNDPLFGRQWALNNIGQTFRAGYTGTPDADIDALEAWQLQIGDSNNPVVVAVIDTGLEPTHPDLAANMWTNPGEIPDNGLDDDNNGYVDDVYGWDFYHDDNTVYDPSDQEFHGTHVAGTIGAVTNNGTGVAGVAWNVRIMALKFLGPSGGYDFDAIRALAYARAMKDKYGLRILTSNSWGGGGYNPALKDAIEASDMLFVAAAGNDAVDDDVVPHYPSAYDLPNIIAVAATDWEDQLSDFSNWGAASVDLAAPGSAILSTYPTDDPLRLGCPVGQVCYVYASGTSMATPHVSGVAALAMSQYPDDGWAAIKQRILSGVDQRPALRGRVLTGGRLNARNVVAGQKPPVITSVSVTPTYAAPGTPVTFSATVSDPDGTVASTYWDFGDSSATVAGLTATHQYSAVGGYFATFHAVDNDGNEAIAGVWVAAVNPGTVVLVDDDGNTSRTDVTEYSFEPVLQAKGIEYARVESALDLPTAMGSPLIWNTGFQYSGTLTGPEQAWLAAFLDNGGRLYLSGEDILYELTGGANGPVSGFAREYLHVASVQHDAGATTLTGVAGDPITDGMAVPLAFADYFSDAVVPEGSAVGILTNDTGGFVALRYYTGTYRLVFGAFAFEAMPGSATSPDPNNAEAFLARVLNFLTGSQVNASPVIQRYAATPRFGVGPLTVNFTATATDSDGTIALYHWDFGDGNSADGASVSHKYLPGSYVARLTVTDNEGATAATTISVHVTGDEKTVVFVDDDDSSPDSERYFEDAFTAAGLSYVRVRPEDVRDPDGSMADGLRSFVVVWNTGEVGYTNDEEQKVLREFLSSGGRLFLSGQDELFNIPTGPGTFATEYLHVASVEHDVQTSAVAGVGGDPITDGMAVQLVYPFSDFSDSIVPKPDAVGIFTNDHGAFNALRHVGAYRVVFFAFPFEAVPATAQDPNNAPTLIGRIIRFLQSNTAPTVVLGIGVRYGVVGSPVTLSAMASDADGDSLAYYWSFDSTPPGSTARFEDDRALQGRFIPDKVGTYVARVTVSDPYGGSATATATVVVVDTYAAPNPARSQTTFYYDSRLAGGTVKIYNVAGRLVRSLALNAGGSTTWDLTDSSGQPLANGLYLWLLFDKDGKPALSKPERLVIQR